MSGVRESGVGDTTIGCPDTLDWPSERLPTEAGMDSVTQSFAQLGFQEQPGVRRISSSQYDLVQVYPKKGKTRFLDPHTKKEVKTKEEDWEEAQVDDNGTWATCYVYGDRVYAFPLEPENAGEDSAQTGIRRISSSQYDFVQAYRKRGKTRFLDPHTKKEVKTEEEDWEEAQVDDNGTLATCYVYEDRVYTFTVMEDTGEPSSSKSKKEKKGKGHRK